MRKNVRNVTRRVTKKRTYGIKKNMIRKKKSKVNVFQDIVHDELFLEMMHLHARRKKSTTK